MSTRAALLARLSGAGIVSGEALGKRLGISRAAVCKAVAALTGSGLEIETVRGRGYRLVTPFEPLSGARIRGNLTALGEATGFGAKQVIVLEETESTSAVLLDRVERGEPYSGVAVVAEAQTAGRGRRGRPWIATPYANVLMSLGWKFDGGPAACAGLSLVVGVAVIEALRAFGVRDSGGGSAALKWPNDILVDGRKLGGILVDLRGEHAGPTSAVIGIGINGAMAPRDAKGIDQPFTDLASVFGVGAGSAPVDRNRLVALLLGSLAQSLHRFAREGFAPFRAAFERDHAHQGRRVRITQGGVVFEGTALGVDSQGALRVHMADGERSFHSGEVSLRARVE